ncbi:hypothetical protein V2J09_007259 [Rumex salicifolius]
MGLSKANTILLFTIALICLNETLVSAYTMFAKYHVIIINGLSHEIDDLEMQCKSSDDDQGDHWLRHNEQYEWSFRVGLFKKKDYTCLVSWNRGYRIFKAFEDDPEFVDENCGGRHCIWKAQDDALYLFDIKDQEFKLTYFWRQKVTNSHKLLN